MAKVNQNKLIGGLAVAVITLLVVIVIVVIAKELFPANSSGSSSTVLGTNTNQLFTAAPVTTTTTTTTASDPYPKVTTTPQQSGGNDLPLTTTPAPSDNLSGQVVYLNSSVYLRSAASWSSDKGEVIKKGQSAKVVKTEGNWYVLEYNGSQGYVAKDYVSFTPIGSSSNDNTTTTAAPET